ncbi:MAG TPA: NUDIX domain-containing protein [Chitinophagaceae bacterium]|nr:NUDIX domain-containing protein [Chitinophagaceae bacterium]
MKEKKSAGILLYRFQKQVLQVFLVHPGGPYWKNKDPGAWSIPKGEFSNEEPLVAAKREFLEETGIAISGTFINLTTIQQKSGKSVHAFAIEGDADAATISSNTFEIEWPPKSGRMQTFSEVDKAEWFSMEEAKEKILEGQVALLIELEEKVKSKW